MDAKSFYQQLLPINHWVDDARKRLYRLRNVMDIKKHDVFISYILGTEQDLENTLVEIAKIKKEIEEQNDN